MSTWDTFHFGTFFYRMNCHRPPRVTTQPFSSFSAITSQKDEGLLYNLSGPGFGGTAGSAPLACMLLWETTHPLACMLLWETPSAVQHLTRASHPVSISLYTVPHNDRGLCWCGSQTHPQQLA